MPGTSGRFGDVCNPNTGEVQARVPIASTNEVRAAVANSEAAQQGWAATNPQKRARIFMKFLGLLTAHNPELARTPSREHGKTVADSLGDIQRGAEVIGFSVGASHLLKDEYSTAAGTGIDVFSMRQPLGVVAGITPFNFPAMIPLGSAAQRYHRATHSFSNSLSATPRCRFDWQNSEKKQACQMESST